MISKLAKFILLSYLLSVVGLLNGQIGIQYWNTEKGLSNDWVSQITQDQDGYIWIATQYGLNRFDGYDFKHYRYEPNNKSSLSANWVRSIAQDTSGTIWIGAFLVGVDAFDPQSGVTKSYQLRAKDSTLVSSIRIITCDQNQTIWISTSAGLFAKKATQETFEHVFEAVVFDYQFNNSNDIFILSKKAILLFNPPTQQVVEILSFEDAAIRKIFIDQANNLWAFGKNQLLKISKQKEEWVPQKIFIDDVAHTAYFYDSPIYEDQQNQLWIGGQDGISIIHPNRKKAKTIAYTSIFPKNSATGKALSFFEDRHDNMWIGTNKGLILQSSFPQRFASQQPISHLDKFNNVREIIQIENHLWIANFEGLHRLDLNQPQLPPQKVLSERIFSLSRSKDGYLYAGGNNFFQIKLSNLAIQKFGNANDDSGFKKGLIWSIAEDKSGKIWLGALSHLQRFNPQSATFDHFHEKDIPSLKAPPTQDLLVDKNGRLWAGSLTEGIFLLENPTAVENPKSAIFRQISYDETNENSLSNKMVLYLTEGKDGMIWVATDAGLNKIDPNTLEVKRFLKKDGLRDEKIMSLISDDAGHLWGSTIGHGIFKLNTQTQAFTFFDKNDGLISNNYLLSAVYKNKDNLLFFGSDNQVQIINPALVEIAEKPKTPFLFTELNLATQDLEIRQPTSLHNKKKIKLPFDYQAFTVQYSTLNYFQAQKTNYQYLLEGLHSDWQYNETKRTLTFTGLSPGTYRLKVKAINPDLNLKKDTIYLGITITPPWWKTWWAYTFYACLFFMGLYAWYRLQLNRQLEKAETRRLRDLDALKTHFFTNITHELRTPLTVILGMAHQLLAFSKKEVQQKASLIQRNGQQLLDLINEVLDLSKLEAGKLSAEMVHGDLLPYLKYLIESFQSLAQSRDIRLHFLPEITELWMDYDEKKIKQIISNLISNALKHSSAGGNIYFQIQQKNKAAFLTIKDTGKGIPKENLPYIFNRFYQVNQNEGGTGIGLALTKELVQFLNGTIDVESYLGKGSTFRIVLPITHNENIPLAIFKEVDLQPKVPLVENISQLQSDLPLLLLVEDNEDVLNYLVGCLQADYRLQISRDGNQGINMALAELPDLIISDIMMPEKDGFELCQTLKNNSQSSHIPIILLTAKADMDSRIMGLEFGADAYLSKPFDPKELKVSVRKLLELRQQLQERFKSTAFWEKRTIASPRKEDKFIQQVRQLVEANLAAPNFSIQYLCQKLSVSRVHLHRKLKALTGQSTTQFINQIRLHKAKALLQNLDLNISEVAYAVGFADPAYFSRLYSEAFGEAPSVTRK